MKVLHVISSLDPHAGGPTVALVGLASAQVGVGLEVVVLTQHHQESMSLFVGLEQNGVEVRALDFHPGLLLPPQRVRRAIEAALAGVEMIHLHGLWSELGHQVARLARRLKIPYLIRPCGMLDPWSLAQSRLKKQVYLLWKQRKDLDCAVALHFTSQAEADSTAALKLKPPSIVEPNGIDLREFETLPEQGDFRRRYPEIGDNFFLVFLGRIHPGKGLELLIPACSQLSDQSAMVVIGGPDSRGYRATMENLVAEHQLQDRVLFAGMLDRTECIAALSDADLFVLPSHHENFGNAVVEALAAGTPVVISDQVNIHDQISAAGVGAVVPLDVAALESALNLWISDNGLRQAAASKCRPFVWQQFDWQQIAGRWKEHYETLKSRSYV